MRRRTFITLFGGAAAAWPLTVRAQSERARRIAYLSATEAPGDPQAQQRRRIMEEALARLGYIEGKNLVIERRLLSDKIELVNEAAAELLAWRPDVIVAVNTPDVAAVLALTTTVPVVFINPADPVASRFITSLRRPGGNATGTTGLTIELIAKRLEVLCEIAPGGHRLGFVSMEKGLSPPLDETNQTKFDAATTIAQKLGLTIARRPLSKSSDVEALFASITSAGDELLYVVFDPLTIQAQKRIAELTLEHKIPAVYEIRDYVISGGLISYTFDRTQNYERAAVLLDRILNGAKPADLPVEQPTRFQLVINLKTAKRLGLTVPDKLLAVADEVID